MTARPRTLSSPAVAAESRSPVLKPMSWFKLNPDNTKIHTPDQVELIAESINTYGFLDPVECLPDGTMLAGEGRYKAMRLLHKRSMPALVYTMEEAHAKGYMVGHNQLNLSTGFDMRVVTSEMSGLNLSDDDMMRMGFGTDEISLFLSNQPNEGKADGSKLGADPSSYKKYVDPVTRSVVKFENREQAEVWEQFLIALKITYPDGETIAERLFSFITDPTYGGAVWSWRPHS